MCSFDNYSCSPCVAYSIKSDLVYIMHVAFNNFTADFMTDKLITNKNMTIFPESVKLWPLKYEPMRYLVIITFLPV